MRIAKSILALAVAGHVFGPARDAAAESARAAGAAPAPAATPTPAPVPGDARFREGVARYLELRKAAAARLPAPPRDADARRISDHQQKLAFEIRAARERTAKEGDLIGPELAKTIKATIERELDADTRRAIAQGNPKVEGKPSAKDPKKEVPAGPIKLKVNTTYPADLPLSTVPPNLLSRLPELPKELQYRFVDGWLIVEDAQARVIVDVLPRAVSVPVVEANAPRARPGPEGPAEPAERLPTGGPVTPPVQQDSLKFAVFGDSGSAADEQYELARRMTISYASFPFKFAIMVGDNIYGTHTAQDYKNKFEDPYKALLDAGVKFYAALGNHDDPSQVNYKLFNMGGKRYYSFKPQNGIRFFALDSNYLDKEQLAWLEKELAGSGSEWKVCFFHHPLYSSGNKHGSLEEARKVLEPLFEKYGVDVVFAGHEHFYERIKPQRGVHYFTTGAAGKLRKGDIRKNSPITEKGFDTDFSFILVEVLGDQMKFQVISRRGETVDSGIITRRLDEPRAAAGTSLAPAAPAPAAHP